MDFQQTSLWDSLLGSPKTFLRLGGWLILLTAFSLVIGIIIGGVFFSADASCDPAEYLSLLEWGVNV